MVFKGRRSARGKSVKKVEQHLDQLDLNPTSAAKTSSTKRDRSKELKALDKIRFDKKTGFQTKKGFLKKTSLEILLEVKDKLIDLINKKLLQILKERIQI